MITLAPKLGPLSIRPGTLPLIQELLTHIARKSEGNRVIHNFALEALSCIVRDLEIPKHMWYDPICGSVTCNHPIEGLTKIGSGAGYFIGESMLESAAIRLAKAFNFEYQGIYRPGL